MIQLVRLVDFSYANGVLRQMIMLIESTLLTNCLISLPVHYSIHVFNNTRNMNSNSPRNRYEI